MFNQVTAGKTGLAQALAKLRSRRGLESFLQSGFLNDPAVVGQGLQLTQLSITQAILLPAVPAGVEPLMPTIPIELVVLNRLRTAGLASPLHLALVEVVRRQYKLAMQAADQADKQRIRASQANPL